MIVARVIGWADGLEFELDRAQFIALGRPSEHVRLAGVVAPIAYVARHGDAIRVCVDGTEIRAVTASGVPMRLERGLVLTHEWNGGRCTCPDAIAVVYLGRPAVWRTRGRSQSMIGGRVHWPLLATPDPLVVALGTEIEVSP